MITEFLAEVQLPGKRIDEEKKKVRENKALFKVLVNVKVDTMVFARVGNLAIYISAILYEKS